MRSDQYVRFLLTIIAGCLLVLVFRAGVLPALHAGTQTTCSGEMRATTAGPLQASIGASYRIEVKCE